jgi:hypothetical protein
MNWLKELMTQCLPLKIEVLPVGSHEDSELTETSDLIQGRKPMEDKTSGKVKLIFICAKVPDSETKSSLLNAVPSNLNCQFVEAIKASTGMELGFTVQARGGVITKFVPKDHHIDISIQGTTLPELGDPLWTDIQEILRKDGYAQSWEIKVNDDKIVYDEKLAQEMASHKIRDHEFTDADMTDLKIMLETAGDVNDFLATLEGKKPQRRSKKGRL